MAHDFVRKIVEGGERSSGGFFFFFIGGSLLIASLFSISIYGYEERTSLLSMGAAVFMGTPLLLRAVRELFEESSEMNELAALGVTATFVSGRFITSATISFVMVLSALLEGRSARGARESLKELLDLKPPKGTVFRDGEWLTVDAEDLVVGDEVRIIPGERLPVDGVVLDGETSINESTITGESLLAGKKSGDEVYAGTVNLTGTVICRVKSVGSETTLGKVQEMISDAEKSRTPVMRMIDRYARWYVPVVMLLSGAVFFVTGDLDRVVSIVVVACPCSILLAGPTAVVALLGVSARLGVLIKDIAHLEVAERITAIVFDKTGTVTTGRLEVTEISPCGFMNEEELLSLACSLERDSSHPVARSLCEKAGFLGLNFLPSEEMKEVHGMGVFGKVRDKSVMVGRRSWLLSFGVDVPDIEDSHFGQSVLYVAVNGVFAGEIFLEDRVKDDVKSSLVEIRNRGVDKIVLLSGDRKTVVERVSQSIGVSFWEFGMLPHQKMDYVTAMKNEGDVVAVVGDGVNDGPALSAGDLSIAMGAAGSGVAISSSSIALMKDDISKIPLVIDLAREALSIMRQNLHFALIAVTLSMILGAVGVLHPIAAAVLHGGTSLTVVFNSARLVRFKGGDGFGV
ncbi:MULTISPECIES: heavy metal translocating P-type ATPase [Dethiosulfovibrio]|uniref:Cation-translocating P-type ATPase n=2 Tax=Dethiosulfovibrio TaxID=47054 RepID=A0ABS9ET44_9BACT|nr:MULTISPECIES: cation-translocating P-type ATPase [Dethiosulfovibrio]MCF4114944.1 cation-translocating P-type ATPase [Dethiosulfovibrio russensis]MCF4143386.1 cation-translocating P-type ATPase [Dethiosulfovibrio marinus]MCF4146008.1 cation-translocating P-type ATPase [Dethiosulfovibrio acidaminovorans]